MARKLEYGIEIYKIQARIWKYVGTEKVYIFWRNLNVFFLWNFNVEYE